MSLKLNKMKRYLSKLKTFVWLLLFEAPQVDEKVYFSAWNQLYRLDSILLKIGAFRKRLRPSNLKTDQISRGQALRRWVRRFASPNPSTK